MVRFLLFLLAQTATICFWLALVPAGSRARHQRLVFPLDVRLMAWLWYAMVGVGILTSNWLGWGRLLQGIGLYLGGRLLFTFAVRVNPFYSPQITVPPVIIRTGVYRWCDHPGYWGHALSALGIWTIWLSWWALPLLISCWAMLGWRAWQEGRMLHAVSDSIHA